MAPPLTKQPPGRQVHLPGMLLSDDGMRRWLAADGPAHLDRLGPGPLDCDDVSHNRLTDDGADALVEFLLRRRQPTIRLKLFQNQLREPSALCRLVGDSRCGVGAAQGLSELHLSHNNVTFRALDALLSSVRRRVDEVGRLRPPFWLRVEKNPDLFEGARNLTEEGNPYGLKLCFEGGKPGTFHCTTRSCRHGADVHIIAALGKRA